MVAVMWEEEGTLGFVWAPFDHGAQSDRGLGESAVVLWQRWHDFTINGCNASK